MADFTTWAALKTAVLNDLSNGSVLTRSYSIGDRSRSFNSLKDVQEFLEYIDQQILATSGSRVNYAQFERPGGSV